MVTPARVTIGTEGDILAVGGKGVVDARVLPCHGGADGGRVGLIEEIPGIGAPGEALSVLAQRSCMFTGEPELS